MVHPPFLTLGYYVSMVAAFYSTSACVKGPMCCAPVCWWGPTNGALETRHESEDRDRGTEDTISEARRSIC